MNFDPNLLINFIPIISVSVLTLVMCITIYFKLRNRWPVKVNCWFCNVNSKVPRWTLDWWLCNYCHQYNGFSKDGDYNYEISEQSGSTGKNSKYSESFCERKSYSSNQNKLCNKCIKMEEQKLIKLRELQDSIGEDNEKQIARFAQNMEKKHPLCHKCQSIVQTVLYKQKLWLMEYKMLLFKHKHISKTIQSREKIEKFLRILLSILASVTIYYSEALYFPLCGLVCQLFACLAHPVNRGKFDVLPIIGWICLICVKTLSTSMILSLLQIKLNSHWTVPDNNMYQYFIITLATAVGLSNLRSQYYKTVPNRSLALKKLESPDKNFPVPQSLSLEPVMSQNQEVLPRKESNRSLYSPVNITNSLLTPESVEIPIPIKPTKSFEWPSKKDSFNPYTKKESSFASTQDSKFPKSFCKETYAFNESLSSLNFLSLGSNDGKVSPTTRGSNQKIFETRVYGTSSPDIFNRYSQQKRSILAPARLRSPRAMLESSWVAGGYWQTPGGNNITDTSPTISRSSSQSSGIGSCAGSMYSPSREPSFHELDQCSVMPLPKQQCCFARPIESNLSITSGSTDNSCKRRSCSSMGQTTPNVNKSSPQSYQCHTKHDLQCSGHTTTIVMNPIWLPVLLCGSLVLNMVVICTTLLR
ncbi:uncharacterized protein LOC106637117 [Copidosoma floridanum]|uniref:uncharacterized protein LOC106637117 n=1 Tax=Copidosoma floridanum TaxID=29053 RepID=UPI0006C98106|nr:uncharacterized protein LOC106637117 [Copidosoma floridanum]